MINILFTASRELDTEHYPLVSRAISVAIDRMTSENPDDKEITLIEGGQRGKPGSPRGGDALANEFGNVIQRSMEDRGYDFHVHTEKAKWHLYGRAAGPIRNGVMVKMAKQPSICVAVFFNETNSKGTKDCVRQAQAAGIEVLKFYA